MIRDNKIICDECGKVLDYVLVDGYSFVDRAMEGVLFKVQLTESKWICIGVGEAFEDYLKQYNWKNWEHWKKLCEEYCEEIDLAECPLCGGEEVLIE